MKNLDKPDRANIERRGGTADLLAQEADRLESRQDSQPSDEFRYLMRESLRLAGQLEHERTRGVRALQSMEQDNRQMARAVVELRQQNQDLNDRLKRAQSLQQFNVDHLWALVDALDQRHYAGALNLLETILVEDPEQLKQQIHKLDGPWSRHIQHLPPAGLIPEPPESDVQLAPGLRHHMDMALGGEPAGLPLVPGTLRSPEAVQDLAPQPQTNDVQDIEPEDRYKSPWGVRAVRSSAWLQAVNRAKGPFEYWFSPESAMRFLDQTSATTMIQQIKANPHYADVELRPELIPPGLPAPRKGGDA